MARHRNVRSRDRSGTNALRQRNEGDRMHHPEEMMRQIDNRKMGRKKNKRSRP